MRRHLGPGVAGGSDLQLGAHHQRMVELADGAHGAERDGAAVRRDEVHEPEGQRLDPRVRRDGKGFVQRAVCFHQRVQRDRRTAECVDVLRGALHVGQTLRLGQHQVGRRARRTQHDRRHVVEARVRHRQQAHADAAVAVERPGQQAGDELRLLDLSAHRCAVLVVQRDVEDRSHLGLQLQALLHACLDAGIVVAHGQRGGSRFGGVEQRLAGVQGGHGVGLASNGG